MGREEGGEREEGREDVRERGREGVNMQRLVLVIAILHTDSLIL